MAESIVIAGQTYRHFKGGLYRVILLATDSETDEEMVVYIVLKTGRFFVRSLTMFQSPKVFDDGREVERFVLVDTELAREEAWANPKSEQPPVSLPRPADSVSHGWRERPPLTYEDLEARVTAEGFSFLRQPDRLVFCRPRQLRGAYYGLFFVMNRTYFEDPVGYWQLCFFEGPCYDVLEPARLPDIIADILQQRILKIDIFTNAELQQELGLREDR